METRTHLFLLLFLLNKLLLLLQDLKFLLVGSFVRNVQLSFVNLSLAMQGWLCGTTRQVFWQGSKGDDQTLHDIISGLLKVESTRQDEQYS